MPALKLTLNTMQKRRAAVEMLLALDVQQASAHLLAHIAEHKRERCSFTTSLWKCVVVSCSDTAKHAGDVVRRLWNATSTDEAKRADVEFYLIQRLMRYAVHTDCRTAQVMEQVQPYLDLGAKTILFIDTHRSVSRAESPGGS